MSKMDRTLSRTPADVERKYGLGRENTESDSYALNLQMQNLQSTMEQYMQNIKSGIENINTEIANIKSEIEELKKSETVTYIVTFYDASGGVVESCTVKKGESVNAPLTDVKWVDNEGAEVTFPYTPTSDTNLYVYQESTQ